MLPLFIKGLVHPQVLNPIWGYLRHTRVHALCAFHFQSFISVACLSDSKLCTSWLPKLKVENGDCNAKMEGESSRFIKSLCLLNSCAHSFWLLIGKTEHPAPCPPSLLKLAEKMIFMGNCLKYLLSIHFLDKSSPTCCRTNPAGEHGVMARLAEHPLLKVLSFLS